MFVIGLVKNNTISVGTEVYIFLTGFALLRRFPIDQGPLDINVNSDPRLLKRRGNDRIEATTENTRTLQIRGHEDNADCR